MYVCHSGNGDILSYEDAMRAKETGVSGIMIARWVSFKGGKKIYVVICNLCTRVYLVHLLFPFSQGCSDQALDLHRN